MFIVGVTMWRMAARIIRGGVSVRAFTVLLRVVHFFSSFFFSFAQFYYFRLYNYYERGIIPIGKYEMIKETDCTSSARRRTIEIDDYRSIGHFVSPINLFSMFARLRCHRVSR